MDTRDAYLVDAFTDEPTCGNPAGVVPDADGLDAEQMQALANELGASETAFVRSSDEADRQIRYFTPETEVDLCGHATIASHALLFEQGVIESGQHTMETEAGVLDISISEDGMVWMTQNAPRVRELDVDLGRVAEALGVDPDSISAVGLPIAWTSTGLPFLAVPIEYFSDLSSLDPDFRAIEALCDEHGATGIYAFTFDTLAGDSTLHGRMFAPGAGVDEDPVTGTASGAVGAYLDHQGALEDTAAMTFEQGHFLDRPGTVSVSVGAEVKVGGRAVTTLSGSIVVPESDDDEILEA
ncbi:PhzF family phenazine biosynthesis protein [Halapricum salinum]|uniref:PhzF family phenazine biosynthesis protein n=1 Tax=Halapricum salinum TaxID=1457250 RepID=A0A4D6HBV8_9EURY|nr:PhzF family phenazine biosynthesis protein [Halapricum salinum]QCC51564.1 PhzF family phenazine biosynthesis protein [Halapricum salinum]